jgi:hypothetical protein
VFKKFLIFLLIVAVLVFIWFVFALWTGIYSFYSYPPSLANPDGATLIVSREEGEPMFNSPEYVPPKENKEKKKGGLRFGSQQIKKQPVETRIIVKLPYIEWAYRQSINSQETEE